MINKSFIELTHQHFKTDDEAGYGGAESNHYGATGRDRKHKKNEYGSGIGANTAVDEDEELKRAIELSK